MEYSRIISRDSNDDMLISFYDILPLLYDTDVPVQGRCDEVPGGHREQLHQLPTEAGP